MGKGFPWEPSVRTALSPSCVQGQARPPAHAPWQVRKPSAGARAQWTWAWAPLCQGSSRKSPPLGTGRGYCDPRENQQGPGLRGRGVSWVGEGVWRFCEHWVCRGSTAGCALTRPLALAPPYGLHWAGSDFCPLLTSSLPLWPRSKARLQQGLWCGEDPKWNLRAPMSKQAPRVPGSCASHGGCTCMCVCVWVHVCTCICM